MSVKRTDLVRMGKYIADLRKNKKFTQKELGDLIDINDKTISKWETGVVAPDITVLKDLANSLDASVDEILCGEKIYSIEEKNSATVAGINLYVHKAKHRIIFIFSIVLLFLFLLFSCLYLINDYYKWNVIDLKFSNNEYFLKGYITYNKNETLFSIENVSYNSNKIGTSEEPKIINLRLIIIYDDVEIIMDEKNFDTPIFLHHCFEKYYFVYESNSIYGDIDLNKLEIRILYVDTNYNEFKIDIK